MDFSILFRVGRTSLVLQWIRIHLPIQWIWVQSLVQEASSCHGATVPVYHLLSLRATATKACRPRAMLRNEGSQCIEKPTRYSRVAPARRN